MGCINDIRSDKVTNLTDTFNIGPSTGTINMREGLVLHHWYNSHSVSWITIDVLLKNLQPPSMMVWTISPNFTKNSRPIPIQMMLIISSPNLLGTFVIKRSMLGMDATCWEESSCFDDTSKKNIISKVCSELP